MASPYDGVPSELWSTRTRKLVSVHPLKKAEIVEVVLASWDSIMLTRLGKKGFRIGRDIFPKPQIIGFFLHELIPLELAARYPGKWRGDKIASEKDIVFVPNDSYSIEIKTSSDPRHIFGNRSYAQASTKGKKAKSGYYLAINFDKVVQTNSAPGIRLIRFGWLDSEDWIGQNAPTGQQSKLHPLVENGKLLEMYRRR